jgi:hypothetical protein
MPSTSRSLSPTPPNILIRPPQTLTYSCATPWQVPRLQKALDARQPANASAQASESRLYTFSDETKSKLRKFRLGTSRAKDPQAVICTLQ